MVLLYNNETLLILPVATTNSGTLTTNSWTNNGTIKTAAYYQFALLFACDIRSAIYHPHFFQS
jgi:hypothetical protein